MVTGEQRKAARVLIANGLAHTPTAEHPAMARQTCMILGLIPSPPPANPSQKHGDSGWERRRVKRTTQP